MSSTTTTGITESLGPNPGVPVTEGPPAGANDPVTLSAVAQQLLIAVEAVNQRKLASYHGRFREWAINRDLYEAAKQPVPPEPEPPADLVTFDRDLYVRLYLEYTEAVKQAIGTGTPTEPMLRTKLAFGFKRATRLPDPRNTSKPTPTGDPVTEILLGPGPIYAELSGVDRPIGDVVENSRGRFRKVIYAQTPFGAADGWLQIG